MSDALVPEILFGDREEGCYLFLEFFAPKASPRVARPSKSFQLCSASGEQLRCDPRVMKRMRVYLLARRRLAAILRIEPQGDKILLPFTNRDITPEECLGLWRKP
jgi:hypothetical protein